MGFTKLEFPFRTQYGELGPFVPKVLVMKNIGEGVSSLKWMKIMGMGVGNTTGGVALSPIL